MYTCTSVTSVIWNPYLLKDIHKLQKVQDRCLALCHEPIQLDSLEKRRNDSDMCETYNILNHKYKINPDSLFQRPTRELRGHQLKLHKVQVNTNVAKHFFSHRAVDSWNNQIVYLVHVFLLLFILLDILQNKFLSYF